MVAMKVLKFDELTISDQKRFVRAEQLLYARSRLRARDRKHHAQWRVLILAGGSPAGEIVAIRELMPKAHITAVDMDPACLSAAIDAGVDEVIQCDLTDYSFDGNRLYKPTAALRKVPKFDLVSLDLCAGANRITRRICRVYLDQLVNTNGVAILTFSYGRDVIEEIDDESIPYQLRHLSDYGASDRNLRRIGYLLTGMQLCRVRSVIIYRGNEMPMCSVLTSAKGCFAPASYVQVELGDFELAVVYPDSASLYDCPQARIDSLRRRFAAIKAVLTRRKSAIEPE